MQELVLRFDGVLVIVGGGTVDVAVLRELAASGAALVGADGGGDVIAAAGLVPTAIIGDLDSLADPAGWEGRTELVRIAEQDTTDFEKALYSTASPVTVALGMTGGRFDHTLAALHAVERHAAGRWIVLVDELDVAVAATDRFRFSLGVGERLSIHPLAPVEFAASRGLRYPLDGLLLAPGVRIGTSNEAAEGTFEIVPSAGNVAPYLVIFGRRHLMPLVAALRIAVKS